ncbi:MULTISPECIES: restriction endonuclease subunit S [Pseudoalteromonas]|uniref:restriction endonuclease subunit S n=1 Tax=Pseudoalteromonas TaxID=53246 RepID=UPI0030CA4234
MLDMEAIKNFSIDKSGWKNVKFGDVVFEPKESVKDPVVEGIEHVVGLEHIDSGDMHLRRSASIEESTTFTKKFSNGDVLFGRRRAYLKKAAKADFEGICSGDITVMRAKVALLLPELLPFVVNNDKFFEYAITHSAGGLSPRVKFKDLANYNLHLPNEALQKSICLLLTSLKNSNQKQLELLANLKTLRNCTLKEIFNNSGDEQSLADIFQIVTGFPYKSKLFNEDGKGKKLMRGINIKEGKFHWSKKIDRYYDGTDGLDDKYVTRAGDILVPMDGSKLGLNYGEVSVAEEGTLLVQRIASFRSKNKLSTQLFKAYLSSFNFIKFIEKNNTTSAIPHISLSQLKTIKLPCISSEVAKQLNIILEIDNSIENLNLNIQANNRFLNNIINKVF